VGHDEEIEEEPIEAEDEEGFESPVFG